MQYRLTFGSQPERVQTRNYKNKLEDYIIFLFLKWDAGKKGIQVCKWIENEEKEHKVMGKKKREKGYLILQKEICIHISKLIQLRPFEIQGQIHFEEQKYLDKLLEAKK